MKIQWFGHSSFKITSENGTTLITDPYSDEIGLKFPDVSSDIITMSHSHFDHNATGAVFGSPVIMEEGIHNYKGITTKTVKTSHDEFSGKHRGANNIFLITADGINLCHMGDLGEHFSAKICEQIKPVDVLFIPVGGVYTIDAAEALKYVKNISPRIVIPMHYKTDKLQIQIDPVDSFLSGFNKEDVTILSGSELELTKEDFNNSATKVVVFKI